VTAGTSCDDGLACNNPDKCSNGVCVGTNPSGCVAAAANEAVVADEDSSVPSSTNASPVTSSNTVGSGVPGYGAALLSMASVIVVLLVVLLVFLTKKKM